MTNTLFTTGGIVGGVKALVGKIQSLFLQSANALKNKENQKLLLAVIAVIAVGVIFVSSREPAPKAQIFDSTAPSATESTGTQQGLAASSANTVDPSGWTTYTNTARAFSIQYPLNLIRPYEEAKDGTWTMLTLGHVPVCHPDTDIVCLYYPKELYLNTQFDGAAVAVAQAYDDGKRPITTGAACKNSILGFDNRGEQTMNGIDFLTGTMAYEQNGYTGMRYVYRAYQNGTCLSVELRTAHTPSALRQFSASDESTVLNTLNQIVETFRLMR